MSDDSAEKVAVFGDFIHAAMLDAAVERKITQLKIAITPEKTGKPTQVRIIVVPETMEMEWPDGLKRRTSTAGLGAGPDEKTRQ